MNKYLLASMCISIQAVSMNFLCGAVYSMDPRIPGTRHLERSQQDAQDEWDSEEHTSMSEKSDDSWIHKKKIKKVKKLLSLGIDVNSKDLCHRTMLHHAAGAGDAHAVAELLKQGADLHTKSVYGLTALRAAAFNGHVEVVLMLLKAGAQIETGETPLGYLSTRYGLEAGIEQLLQEGGDVNEMNRRNRTLLGEIFVRSRYKWITAAERERFYFVACLLIVYGGQLQPNAPSRHQARFVELSNSPQVRAMRTVRFILLADYLLQSDSIG